MNETVFLEGSISVKAALETGRRPVLRLICDGRKPDRNRAYIFRLAQNAGIPVQTVSEEELNGMATGRSHGGLLAEAGARRYETPEELFAQEDPFLVLLDGVEDPYNLGTALRSLYAAGVTGVLLPVRDRLSMTPTVLRASAGASEHLPIACAEDWGILDRAKERGIRILCAERKDAIPLYDADLTGKILLVFGGEMRGISTPILDRADGRLYLPYGRDFRNALSASAAAAVFSFEAYRQRRK